MNYIFFYVKTEFIETFLIYSFPEEATPTEPLLQPNGTDCDGKNKAFGAGKRRFYNFNIFSKFPRRERGFENTSRRRRNCWQEVFLLYFCRLISLLLDFM